MGEVDRDVAAIRARELSGEMYVLREASQNGNADGIKSAATNRRNSIQEARLRELEVEAEKLISPLASRAASPVLSPQQAPALPPEMGSDLIEFTLNRDGLDDFDLDGGGAATSHWTGACSSSRRGSRPPTSGRGDWGCSDQPLGCQVSRATPVRTSMPWRNSLWPSFV